VWPPRTSHSHSVPRPCDGAGSVILTGKGLPGGIIAFGTTVQRRGRVFACALDHPGLELARGDPALDFGADFLINFRNRTLICKACLRKYPKVPEIRVPVAERRALKQAQEKIRVQEEAVRLKRRLLQRA
jgi:hypothetical protein